ncbi:MAG: tripartite tricarboxylate transporter permease [Lachnoclostridium edouardi]|uniref:tripartite tricarboxylate transporter permease n=1 Tax=Lachnoclostridium edouardi TaxID=1926283 RepID=UPI0026DAF23C|nr:tripartite tricarboxylate transporter permease [Lachnoclostridium edouardi]MDO4277599.1 tripartite tricarboxylate transporter permease [Lachnoclostridium edouardi]
MELLQGFQDIFNLTTLLLMLGGVFGGLVIGALPGLSAFTALAIMLPFTFGMDPVNGISFLMAIYVGGCSGGLISAILLGIPGTPSSIATCFDGFPMAKNGEAKKALGTAVLFSFIGGIFGALVLSFVGPYIARVALKFSSYDYFAIILFALTTVSALSEGSMIKGLLSCLLGISLGFVGTDSLSSYYRYTFGINKLANGFNLVPVLIGLFAVSQIMITARDKAHSAQVVSITNVPQKKVKGFGLSMKEFLFHMKTAIPCAIIGLVIGILPGLGGNVSNLMAYSYAKKTSKYPEKFGTGIPDGVVASETANNATVGGAVIILLTLGIPGDNATSIILAGFQMHDVTPGPLLFKTSGELVYAILAAFILANVMFFIMEYFGLPIFTKMLSVPSTLLLPVVIVCCFVGSYCANNNSLDILIMVLFGLLGYVLKKYKYPLAPLVVGFILAPLLETYLRRSLMKTDGSFLPIIQSPIAAVFLICTVIAVVYTAIGEIKKAKQAA